MIKGWLLGAHWAFNAIDNVLSDAPRVPHVVHSTVQDRDS